jgi:Uri superfamily endonuclease
LKGSYCLIISAPTNQVVTTTALGDLEFEKGYWVYIGSAQGTTSTNLSNRLRRHFKHEKKIHWHIDHLLASKVTLSDAVWAESSAEMECAIAQHLESKSKFSWGPKGFGSSDCTNSCRSHVLYYQGKGQPHEQIGLAFQTLGLSPLMYSVNQPVTR